MKKTTLAALVIIAAYVATFLFLKYIDTSWIDVERNFPVHNGGDSGGYDDLAKNLIKNGVFSYDTTPPFTAEALRSPGYPYFASIVLRVFETPTALSLVQILLTLVGTLLLYDTARIIMRKEFALLTALLYCLNPSILFYSTVMLSDVLFVFLEILIVWLIFKHNSRLAYISAFLLLGAAVLVRPSGSYLFVIFIAYLLTRTTDRSFYSRLVLALLCIISTASITVPWMYRNYQEFNRFEVSSVGPYTLLFYDMEALREKQGIPRDQLEHIWLKEIGASSRAKASTPAFSDANKRLFLEEFKRTPIEYALFHGSGSARFFVGSGLSDVLTSVKITSEYLENNCPKLLNALKWLDRLFMACMFILLLLSPYFMLRQSYRTKIMVTTILLLSLYTALIVGPIPNARYRIASLPFIFMGAMYSLSQLFERQTFYNRKSSTLL